MTGLARTTIVVGMSETAGVVHLRSLGARVAVAVSVHARKWSVPALGSVSGGTCCGVELGSVARATLFVDDASNLVLSAERVAHRGPRPDLEAISRIRGETIANLAIA